MSAVSLSFLVDSNSSKHHSKETQINNASPGLFAPYRSRICLCKVQMCKSMHYSIGSYRRIIILMSFECLFANPLEC